MTVGKFLFLGTSSSTGVPVIGCRCSVCISSSPFNARLRPSALLQVKGLNLLLDVGPDFRMQALQYRIDHLDGLILTHTHFDHIAGIDDLRIYCARSKSKIPCLLSQDSLKELEKRYDYLFTGAPPLLKTELLPSERGITSFLGIELGYTTYEQGGMKVTGYRFGNLAYVTDIREFDPSIFSFFEGVQTLVLSAAREEKSKLHLSVDEAVAFAKRANVKQTFLTHLSHSLDYEMMNQKLPPSVRLAFDGQQIEFKKEIL